MRGALGYVTLPEELTGVGTRILAERDRLLREARETVGPLASRAVQEVV